MDLRRCSLAPKVAEEIVHNEDLLNHILDLIWEPGKHSRFTKFAILVLVNLTRAEEHRQIVLGKGGLAALIGVLLGPNYGLQVQACKALANLALSPADEVDLLDSDVFIERVLTKLSAVYDPETLENVAHLIRNLSARERFTKALLRPQHKTVERLKFMRNVGISEEAQRAAMAATNTLQEYEFNRDRWLQFMARVPPSHEPEDAEVTWQTWASKLDTLWNPIFTQAPTAQGFHLTVEACTSTNDAFEILKLKGTEPHDRDLSYVPP